MSDTFSTIVLSNGIKVDVLELKPFMLWKANYQSVIHKNLEYDFAAFIFQQCLLFDGKMESVEYIGNLTFSDYNKIAEIVTVSMKQIPSF